MTPCLVYSPAERRADAAIHVLGLASGTGATLWMLASVDPAGPQFLPLLIYCLGLMGMLAASASYNLVDGPTKAVLRRIDHAMIFAMIAGTYTPLVMLRLPPDSAQLLRLVVWGGGGLGMALKLACPGRFETLAMALYLVLGWAILWAIGPLADALSVHALWLVVAGGVLYTVGVPICFMERMPYHNACWHALVLAAAGCHFAAMAIEFT